jgi:hypothetical protein
MYKDLISEFDTFHEDFDLEMDAVANKADFARIER